MIPLVFLPLLARSWIRLGHTLNAYWIPAPDWRSFLISLENFGLGYNSSLPAYWIFDAACLVISAYVMRRAAKAGEERKKLLFSSLLFSVPMLAAFVFSRFVVPVYLDRGLIVSAPFFYILLGAGLDAMGRKLRAVLLAAVILLTASGIYGFYRDRMPAPLSHHTGVHLKKPFKPAVEFIKKTSGGGDIIAFTNDSLKLPFIWYSEGRNHVFFDKRRRNAPGRLGKFRFIFAPGCLTASYREPKKETEFNIPLDKAGGMEFKRLFLLACDWPREKGLDVNSSLVKEELDRRFSLKLEKEFQGLWIYCYEKNEKLILAVLKQILSARTDPEDVCPAGGIDRAALMEMLQYHQLTPFAYLFFRQFPDTAGPFLDALKRKYDLNLARNMRFQEEFLRLHNIFQSQDIDIVPFKGLALLPEIYGRCPVRPMKDMDILVKEELLEKAEGILEKHGYSKHLGKGSYSYWREHNLNIPFLKNRENWLLELHFAVDLKRSRPILPEMWKRIRAVRQDDREINMLSPEDTLFNLALHQRRFGSPLCLKNTLDISLLLRRHKIDFDWDYVCREAGMGLMRTTVFFALRQAELFTGCMVPARVMKDLRVPSWKRMLISSFIENNIFNTAAFSRPKRLYLQTHLLIYDGLLEPVGRILNISREEFSKFYDLPLYTARTETLYRIRFLFMLYKLLSGEKGDPAAGSGYRHG